jgi:hypothetical protein
MKAFLAFVIGLVIGVLVQRYVLPSRGAPLNTTATSPNREPVAATADLFDREKIKEELARSGQVIREKARVAGAAISDAAANARITATIKAKLIGESSLAAFKINVDTTDGVVTLSGTVNSPEEVGKAMSLALETEGVHKVISTLQVKPR